MVHAVHSCALCYHLHRSIQSCRAWLPPGDYKWSSLLFHSCWLAVVVRSRTRRALSVYSSL